MATARIEEFQTDGMEVAPLIEDEPDPHSYLERARSQGHYGPAVETVLQHMRDGVSQRHSDGFGIGLDRLAMAATGRKDIPEFIPSHHFVRELQHAD